MVHRKFGLIIVLRKMVYCVTPSMMPVEYTVVELKLISLEELNIDVEFLNRSAGANRKKISA